MAYCQKFSERLVKVAQSRNLNEINACIGKDEHTQGENGYTCTRYACGLLNFLSPNTKPSGVHTLRIPTRVR